jgi:hypothetical protein
MVAFLVGEATRRQEFLIRIESKGAVVVHFGKGTGFEAKRVRAE